MVHSRFSDPVYSAKQIRGGIHAAPFFSEIIALLVLPLLAWPEVAGASPAVYFSIDGFAHSESKSIKSITDNWDGDLYSGDVAFSVDRAEAGIDWGRWRFGYIKRYDYYFDYSPDTAELIHKAKNKIPLIPGRQYDLHLSANTMVSNGLRLTYQREHRNVWYGLSVSYLNGQRFSNGAIRGDAVALSDKDYDFEFDVDYFYSEDKLFDRSVDAPNGQGYAIDVNLTWQFGDRLKLGFRVDDLLARMHWRDAPRTVAVATSDTKEFDEDGYVIYKPVISGIETNQDFVQKLPDKLFLSVDYAIGQYTLDLQYSDYEIKSFYTIGVNMANDRSSRDFFCNLTAGACGIGYSNDWIKLKFMTDTLQLQDARTLEIVFSAIYAF